MSALFDFENIRPNYNYKFIFRGLMVISPTAKNNIAFIIYHRNIREYIIL